MSELAPTSAVARLITVGRSLRAPTLETYEKEHLSCPACKRTSLPETLCSNCGALFLPVIRSYRIFAFLRIAALWALGMAFLYVIFALNVGGPYTELTVGLTGSFALFGSVAAVFYLRSAFTEQYDRARRLKLSKIYPKGDPAFLGDLARCYCYSLSKTEDWTEDAYSFLVSLNEEEQSEHGEVIDDLRSLLFCAAIHSAVTKPGKVEWETRIKVVAVDNDQTTTLAREISELVEPLKHVKADEPVDVKVRNLLDRSHMLVKWTRSGAPRFCRIVDVFN